MSASSRPVGGPSSHPSHQSRQQWPAQDFNNNGSAYRGPGASGRR